jgi:exonuclease III
MLADRVAAITVAKEYRSAKRPSDHVPVTATLEL